MSNKQVMEVTLTGDFKIDAQCRRGFDNPVHRTSAIFSIAIAKDDHMAFRSVSLVATVGVSTIERS